MAADGRGHAALVVLTVATIPGLFRDLDTGDREGQAVAIGLSLAVGVAASALARSPWPVLATAGMIGYLIHRTRKGTE